MLKMCLSTVTVHRNGSSIYKLIPQITHQNIWKIEVKLKIDFMVKGNC